MIFICKFCIHNKDYLRMMYKNQNKQECMKKQILLIYIVHLLDKYNKIIQNTR